MALTTDRPVAAARLRRLSIRDLVLIDALDIDFAPGLNVLTGETGAGKSILLDALGLTLGAKADPGLVRLGAARGSAAAAFVAPVAHPAVALLLERDLIDPDEAAAGETVELILRRVLPRDGRSRAFLNDQPVGLPTLKALGAELVDVHGQGEDRAVADPRGRRAALDAYGALQAQAARLRGLFADWRAAAASAEEAARAAEEAGADRDYLAHALDELTAAAPEPDEEDRLEAERRRLKSADRLSGALSEAAEALAGGADAVGASARRLSRAVDAPGARGGAESDAALADPDRAAVDAALTALDEALLAADAARDALAAAEERFRPDPDALESAEARLFLLRALARKHRVAPNELPGLIAPLSERLSGIDGHESRRRDALAAAERLEADYAAAAETLTARRRAAAERFDAAVAAELPDLRLPRAQFRTALSRAEAPGPDGLDRVDFLAAFNPGAAEGPVERIGSGGELSRLLLAVKVVLAAHPAPTAAAPRGPILVFDEIDRGVGGAAADAVGRRLQRLALAGGGRGPDDPPLGQVVVVTHAPQIAARADRHWRLSKSADGADQTRTRIEPLTGPARTEEVARMLSGEAVSDPARAAAQALIEAAPERDAPARN